MKHRIIRVLAALLAVIMCAFVCGCEDMLYLLQDYGDISYDDGDGGHGGGMEDGYQYYYVDGHGGQGGAEGDGVIVVSDIPDSDVLSEAIRKPLTTLRGNGEDVVTVMIYICASNLESDNGLAYTDIKEMMKATANANVNIVIETGGCKSWSTNQISGRTNQRHLIKNGRLTTIDDSVGRKDMTDDDTLSGFIKFCAKEYPANRNILVLWDHGAGAVDGWGYDEYNYNDSLTIDELGEALFDAGVKFDFIGFDACLMSTMEVACVLYDFADYMIASEDYESGYGWYYTDWLSELAGNTSVPTPQLAKTICDDFVTSSGTDDAILALVDLSYMKLIYTAWKEFAIAAQDQLLDANYSWSSENQSRGAKFSLDDLIGYSTEANIDDMLAMANTVDNVAQSEALISALSSGIVYCSANSGCSEMTGLAVTLPYGDSRMYENIKEIFGKVGFDKEYIEFLGKFVEVSHGADSYDWSEWYDSYSDYGTWSDYYDEGYGGSEYDWDSWDGWESYFAGLLGGSVGSYYSDYFSDYYSDYGDYEEHYSDEYESYDDYFSSIYGDDYYDQYYDDYYDGYDDYGFGYSDYDSYYNDYYDYYDDYYDSYYGDYYYGGEEDSWDDWFSGWLNW